VTRRVSRPSRLRRNSSPRPTFAEARPHERVWAARLLSRGRSRTSWTLRRLQSPSFVSSWGRQKSESTHSGALVSRRVARVERRPALRLARHERWHRRLELGRGFGEDVRERERRGGLRSAALVGRDAAHEGERVLRAHVLRVRGMRRKRRQLEGRKMRNSRAKDQSASSARGPTRAPPQSAAPSGPS